MPSHKRVQRATQWVSARYGTERAVLASRCLAAGHQLSGHPFGCPPLTYPPTPTGAGPRHPALAGHFLFSAKLFCMGKQKNRLTATQRGRPRAPDRGVSAADARPPTGARSCRSSLPGSQPTLGLPCTRRGRRRTFSQPFLEISVRFPLASPAGPREPYRVAGLPCTQPSQAGAPRSLPGSPASAVQGSRAAYPGASARPHRRSVSPASPTGRRAH
jgi:hypothetical protein